MSGNGLKGYKFVRGHELIMLKILLLLGSLCLKKITWFKVWIQSHYWFTGSDD